MTDIASLISTSSPVAATGDVGTDASPEEFADALASATSEMGADDTTAETDDTETAETESPSVEQLLLGLEPSAQIDADPTAAPALSALAGHDSGSEEPLPVTAQIVADGTDTTALAAGGNAGIEERAAVADATLPAAAAPSPGSAEPDPPTLLAELVTVQAAVAGPQAAPDADQTGTPALPTDDTEASAPTATPAAPDAHEVTAPPVASTGGPAVDELPFDDSAPGVPTDSTEIADTGPVDELPGPMATEPGADTSAAMLTHSDAPSLPTAATEASATPTVAGADPVATAAATQATTPTTPTAPADVAEATTAPAAPTPYDPAEASPATQVAEALRDVRRLTDGTHRLSLQLHPEDLGAVQLEVALREGRLHLRAVAQTEAGRSALQSSLPELRSELLDAGVNAGSLEVGGETADGSAHPQTSGDDRGDTRPTPTSTGSTATRHDLTTPTPNPMSTSSLVDVRL